MLAATGIPLDDSPTGSATEMMSARQSYLPSSSIIAGGQDQLQGAARWSRSNMQPAMSCSSAAVNSKPLHVTEASSWLRQVTDSCKAGRRYPAKAACSCRQQGAHSVCHTPQGCTLPSGYTQLGSTALMSCIALDDLSQSGARRSMRSVDILAGKDYSCHGKCRMSLEVCQASTAAFLVPPEVHCSCSEAGACTAVSMMETGHHRAVMFSSTICWV